VALFSKVEREAAARLAVERTGLIAEGASVRRVGPEWFYGPPLRISPDTAAGVAVPDEFAAMIASWIVEQASDEEATRRLLADASLLHDSHARASALRLLFALGMTSDDPWRFVDLLGRHPDGGVREVSVGVLATLARHAGAQRRLASLTHDPDDRVFLKAFRAIGALRIDAAWSDLLHIMHNPAAGQILARQGRDANPVGLGAAHVMLAILQVAGTDEPRELMRLQEAQPPSAALDSERFETAALLQRLPRIEATVPRPASALDIAFVSIPGGAVRVGLEERDSTPFYFRQKNTPVRNVHLNPYSIAQYPVTNEQYMHFLSEWAQRGAREYEHPLQVEGKDHWPASLGDPRFGPTDPVCGIDWFDAYAYCAFYGVRLPSEDEWEWAARGPKDEQHGSPHSFEASYGPFEHLNQWRRTLNETTADYPSVTTVALDDARHGGLGVCHAVGNVWEYTSTNAYTQEPMSESLPDARLNPEQTMSQWPFHVVIKGGAWTSVGDLLLAAYRGSDLYTDRHREIGFRVAR
jgi:formylglycine-generating enzyme required for sulfatase activity